MKPSDTQYERLRPDQIKQQRTNKPVAYLPIGTLEWHGVHNPVGLDTLKAHQLCIKCAEAHGGLVLPPLWYGENRENALLESSCGLSEPIAKEMGLPEDSFNPGYMGRSIAEQDRLYQDLLLHMMFQANSLGFKVLAICAGHYPLIDQAKAACHIFHQQTYHKDHDRKMIPYVFTGYELVGDKYPFAGDHAAYWETSLLMALDEGHIDLSRLPEKPEDTLGVGGHRPAQESSKEEGMKYVADIVEAVGKKIDERLADPIAFYPHNLRY